jgi:hypothetical protein
VPDDPGNRDDRLAAAVAELYEASPEDFTGRRGELAAAARDAGDRPAARAIGGLRRPTRAAWVVNRLAYTDPGAPRRLAELADALSAAQRAGDGPRLRELSAERWALIDTLTAQALAAAGVADPPPSLRLEVAQTITAALADPAVAADFAAGRLTKAAQWSGFGLAPEPAGTGGAAGASSGAAALRGAPAGPGPAGTADDDTLPAGRRRLAEARGPRAARPAESGAKRRAEDAQREAAERAAREAAERAARRREQYEEAERGVAVAAAAAAEAGAAEDRLEEEVRDLEQRLTRARAELATARMRARHAESADRRARQAFDRLPEPEAVTPGRTEDAGDSRGNDK